MMLVSISALYSDKGDVIQATAKDFKDVVLKDKGIVIVEFYAPWCGHCKSLAPEYEKAAKILSGVVKIVAVDATAHESIASKYQIKGFPTIKVFGADKKSPTDYQGERTSNGIVSEAMKQATSLVKQRKDGKGSSSGSDSKKGGNKSKGSSKSEVIELNEANFNALLMESNEPWLVEFFAPWCGHCKKLEPEWKSAASQLKNDGIKLGAVDATVSKDLAQKYGIQGFPTIKMFPGGKKSKAKDYNGPREADGIVDYARNNLGGYAPPVELKELTSASVFKDTCGSSKLCAILFVPHILDTGATGRNVYLEEFKEIVGESDFRKMPFSFTWSSANDQPELEQVLNVNNNFPTVVMLSIDKKAYAVPKVSWSRKNIQSFMKGVLSGIEKTSKLSSELPTISTIAGWDGKDGKIEVEEMSLSDLDL